MPKSENVLEAPALITLVLPDGSERVVPSGVSLADATKLVMIGSVLNESIKADIGVYAQAVNDFVADYMADGDALFGVSLFA